MTKILVTFIKIEKYEYIMVSKLYKASNFYEMQTKGKIAKGMNKDLKLRKDNKGYFVSRDKGKKYIKGNDLVYSRQEGVTPYSQNLDKKINSSNVKETPKKHSRYAHMRDRKTRGGRDIKV